MRLGRLHIVLLFVCILALSGCVTPLPGGPGSPVDGDDGGGKRPGMVTKLEIPVSDPRDDGWRNTSVGKTDITLTSPVMWFGGSPGNYEADAFFRWRNVQIPTGATILEAKVLVKHQPTSEPGLNKWNAYLDIYGFAYDNLQPFTVADDPATLAFTKAMAGWDLEDAWSSTESVWQETPDLKDVVQEIVSRQGWRAGNALGIIFKTRPDTKGDIYNRVIYSRSSNAEMAPVLFIRYTR